MNNTTSQPRSATAWWEAALLLRGQTEADQRNIRLFSTWCFIWAVGFIGVQVVLKKYPGLGSPLAVVLALIPIALGLPALRAFLRYLREADEFTRKVQLEGIALGFGTGMLFCMGYFTLEQFGAPRLPLLFAVVPMSFGWAVGSLLVAARYR